MSIFFIPNRTMMSFRQVLAYLFLTLFVGSISPNANAAFREALWGARPAGMAGTFTALADDANAPSYNPAGIAFLETNEITVMYAQLLVGVDLYAGDEKSDLGLGYLSVIPRIKNKHYGSFGVSWTNFNASNVLREDSVALTYADVLTLDRFDGEPLLAYGANLRYLRHSFSPDQYTAIDPVFRDGRSADAMAVDLGLMFRPNWETAPGLKFGLAAQNMNEPNVGLYRSDRVPARYTLGIAYQDRRYRLFTPAVDISRRAGRTLVSLAWEGWMARDSLALRLGGNEDQLGGGLGYQFKLGNTLSMRLDYSLLWPLDIDGSHGNHRVSLTTNF
jgi:hypothetical protein